MNQDNSNQSLGKSRNKIVKEEFDGKPDKCVIYARANHDIVSLTKQREACEKYAKENGLEVIAYFGHKIGLEGREDFKKMWDFVIKNSSHLKCILVYSMDRISRIGASSIFLINELETRLRVEVRAVNLPQDPGMSEFAKSLKLIVAGLNNKTRRERILLGLKKRAKSGLWIALPPYGYKLIGAKKSGKLVITKEGKFIRKAFKGAQ